MKPLLDRMVDRFLGWKLPRTFAPDAGINFTPYPHQHPDGPHWPIGTNLLTATEARAMLEHVVGGAHLCGTCATCDYFKAPARGRSCEIVPTVKPAHDFGCVLHTTKEATAGVDSPARPRCSTCDDSGDVHDATGQWRGRCSCPAGVPQMSIAQCERCAPDGSGWRCTGACDARGVGAPSAEPQPQRNTTERNSHE